MKSNSFMKIDYFARRHLLPSSFVCLIILSFIQIYYMRYALPISSLHKAKVGEILVDLFMPTIWITLFHSIPIFAISILLSHFLKKKTYIATLRYYKRFLLSFAPTLAIILFLLIRVPNALTSYSNIPYPYHMAILTSFVYSAIFSAFFTWLSKASKERIIIQSIVISILVGTVNKIIFEFGSSSFF